MGSDFSNSLIMLLSLLAQATPYLIGLTVLLVLSLSIPLRSRGFLTIGIIVMMLGQLANPVSNFVTLLADVNHSGSLLWRFVFSPYTNTGIFFIAAFVAAQWPYRHNTYINAKQLFFGFNDCIPRNIFWVASLLLSYGQYAALSGLLTIISMAGHYDNHEPALIAAAIAALPAIALFAWSGFAIYAKRWHDLGKSGWWTLISLIPIIGPLYCLVMLGFVKGQNEEYPRAYMPSANR